MIAASRQISLIQHVSISPGKGDVGKYGVLVGKKVYSGSIGRRPVQSTALNREILATSRLQSANDSRKTKEILGYPIFPTFPSWVVPFLYTLTPDSSALHCDHPVLPADVPVTPEPEPFF